MSPSTARLRALLQHPQDPPDTREIPELTDERARLLVQRIDGIRVFAHAYALLSNLTYGAYGPYDVLDFAARHGLAGACIHLLDGEEQSLGRMDDVQLIAFRDRAQELQLDVHLELSTTDAAEIDELVRIAGVLNVTHLRVYSRFEGLLSEVMERIEQDLRRLADLADEHDLHFSFEQHEELRSGEIVALLRRIGHPRLHVLFDFGNMINAGERPLDALDTLAPHILQTHLKGVHILPEGDGTGHRGVLQGGPEDDLPGARMLYELLMLGDDDAQVIAFALEQENHYYAPAFRTASEGENPFIPYRDLSTTGIPDGWSMDDLLAAEPGWADDQVAYVHGILARMHEIALNHLENSPSLTGTR